MGMEIVWCIWFVIRNHDGGNNGNNGNKAVEEVRFVGNDVAANIIVDYEKQPFSAK